VNAHPIGAMLPASKLGGDRWRTLLAALVVIAAGCYATYTVTDGLQAFSLESARRLSALRSPAPVPNPMLEFADERRAPLIVPPHQVLLVDFVYTRCETYCRALGSLYAQLQTRLAPQIASGKVRLVSLTFDPNHDGPRALQSYRDRHGGAAPGWDLARPLASQDLEQLLRGFGVVVIDDGLGGYTHNAAVHIVDRQGRLAAIVDADDPDAVVRFTLRMLEGETHARAL
jgi:protein SCO1/2